MTGLEKLMKWYLEKDTRNLTVDEMLGIVIDKANALIAEERSPRRSGQGCQGGGIKERIKRVSQ